MLRPFKDEFANRLHDLFMNICDVLERFPQRCDRTIVMGNF